MYLTWSAMTNQPDHLCKADLAHLVFNTHASNSSSSSTAAAAVPDPDKDFMLKPDDHPTMDTASIFGLVLWFCCILYSSIRSSSNSQAAKLTMSDK